MIVAAAENNVIGNGNKMLWHLPDDFKFFKENTRGCPIIMGRKTFESILDILGKPLPQRTNIIITRNNEYHHDGIEVASSLDEALEIAKRFDTSGWVSIGGGGEIYKQALAKADLIYLTRVHHTFDGDTYFPEVPSDNWQLTNEEYHPTDDRHKYAFTFLTYERK